MPESLSQLNLVMLVAVIWSAKVGLAASMVVWFAWVLLRARRTAGLRIRRRVWEEPAFESSAVRDRVERIRHHETSGFEEQPDDELRRMERVTEARGIVRERSYFEHARDGFSDHGNPAGQASV